MTKNITIGSHNLHSFKQSASYHKACLKSYGGIWFGQELWLSEKQLHLLQHLETQFVARSGMEQAVSDGLLVGRPFGGVSIAWSPDLNPFISPLSNIRHKRVVGIELKTTDSEFLFLCIYMPFYNTSRRVECISETIDTIAMLDTIIEQYPNHNVIIGGDFNSELKGVSPFDQHWDDFMRKNQLACCDFLYPSDTFTYHHQTLQQKKWNDHFLIRSSFPRDNITSAIILDDGDNVSDHLPIILNLTMSLKNPVKNTEGPSGERKLRWNSLSSQAIDGYTERLRHLVDALPAPEVELRCAATCICDNNQCHESIQSEYDNIVSSLKRADFPLPRHKPGAAKDWWTEGLTALKQKSIEIHSLWKKEGCPRQGPIHTERIRVRASYKSALRNAQRAPKQAAWDRLHSALSHNETTAFWKHWRQIYNKNKCDLPPVVDGVSAEKDIANAFRDCFQKNSKPNNIEKVHELNRKFATAHHHYMSEHRASCNCSSFKITVVDVIDALLCMKGGKSADADSISVEHLHNAPLNLLCRLATLFNLMLIHSFVPRQFREGFMIPLVKDQQGNRSDTGNYRGITISPIISKVLEHILKNHFAEYLDTSPNQFGFKRKNSTAHALHCLRETVNYFVNNDSRVFCSFLDASKAFDRLVHSGLFLKLINRNVPVIFLNFIISWYSELRCRIKWGTQFSDWFLITAGVRQGGILSPDFYSIYVDDLVSKMKESGKGCQFLNHFVTALFYADDMAIIAPSIHGLEILLNICSDYCLEWDICLNVKKSKNLYFGKPVEIHYDIMVLGKAIEWVTEWTYLGVKLKSSKQFDCSVKERVHSFYRSANAILRIDGKSNDMVMLQLIESHCVPILTYATEIIHVSNRDERRQLRVAYNSIFRKLFSYKWTESVSALQAFLGRPTWEQLVEARRTKFLKRICEGNPHSLPRQFIT